MPRALRERLRDPYWCIPRFAITDKNNVTLPLGRLRPEQEDFLATFLENDRILVLKARQVGLTTISTLAMLWYVLTLPQGGGVIQLTHESDAIASLNGMLRTAVQSIPAEIRPFIHPDTANYIGLDKGNKIKARFRQRMAGGRSQGRAFTYQHQHYTEMAFFPQGSASVKGRGVDRQVWASVNATVKHQSGVSKTIVESTGNGPEGMFYDLCAKARGDSGWAFLFFPWFFTNEYAMDVPKGFEVNEDEAGLLSLYGDKGLDLRHLVWRRMKMETENLDIENFRREYPSNPDEPFYATGSTYFNLAKLNLLSSRADASSVKQDWMQWEQPIPGRQYFIGQDTSGGVGKDYAVIVVLRDDGKMVARWRSNHVKPIEQARMAAKISATYNRGIVLVEANRHGRAVFEELGRLGVNRWTQDGKPYWTQRGSISSKDQLVALAAELLDGGAFDPGGIEESWLPDPVVISELASMREDKLGNVCAPNDHHDDSAMAWMLALWCARRNLRKRATTKLWTPEEARAHRQRALLQLVTPRGPKLYAGADWDTMAPPPLWRRAA